MNTLRLLLVLGCAMWASAAFAQVLSVPKPEAENCFALDPVLIRLSEAQAEGRDWRALAKSYGALV